MEGGNVWLASWIVLITSRLNIAPIVRNTTSHQKLSRSWWMPWCRSERSLPFRCVCVSWVFPANIYIVLPWLIVCVWILTFVNESCRTGSEITLRELGHTSVRREEFSQLSEVTWEKNHTNNQENPYKWLSGFNHVKPNKCCFTIAYCMTHSISLLLIKTWTFHHLAEISKQR